MSPEDDQHLHTVQLPRNDSLNNDWNSKAHKLKDNNLSPKNHIHSTNGYINGDAILKQNGDSQTWLPLLGQHPNDIDHNLPSTNNNKWPALTSPANLSNSKYVWKELPQDDESMGLFKPNLNGKNGGFNSGNGLNGMRNGRSDKNEHESLTGIVRQPNNGYANDLHDDDDDESNCGIGICKPRWARCFASTHVFMVIFLLAWILQVIFH